MKHDRCPGCYSSNIEDFFVVKNAPVHSVITIKSREEALAVPREDITLAFCKQCGFVFNRTFNTEIDFFTKGYEDQQSFSPTFTKFITQITSDFIEKYKIRNTNIVEIGCGKGDYLKLFCDLGNNRGVGIDPAFIKGRIQANPNVSFIQEFYSEKHGEIPKKLITCRHTLEHIHNTRQFLKTIRESEKKGNTPIVFFEVPNLVRILKENAFWDIFYEHCSYFSPGSLTRLFRLNQFQILNVFTGYEKQYLFLEGRLSQEESKTVFSSEESPMQLKTLIDEFVKNSKEQLKKWRARLQQMKRQNDSVAIWGGGSKTVGFLTHFDDVKVIELVVDINPHIQGNFIPGIGLQYASPRALKEFNPDKIIVMNGIYKDEIRNKLSELRLYPELICL